MIMFILIMQTHVQSVPDRALLHPFWKKSKIILIPSIYQEYDIFFWVSVNSITVMDKFIIIIRLWVFRTDYMHNIFF